MPAKVRQWIGSPVSFAPCDNNAKVGYQESADIAKTAIATGESVRQVLKNKNILSDAEIEKLLDPATMV